MMMLPLISTLFLSALVLFVTRLTVLPHLPATLPAVLAGTGLVILVAEGIEYVWRHLAEIVEEVDPDAGGRDAHERMGVLDPDDAADGAMMPRRCELPQCPLCKVADDLGRHTSMSNEEFAAKATEGLRIAFARGGYVSPCHPSLQCTECAEPPTTVLPRAEDGEAHKASPTVADLAYAWHRHCATAATVLHRFDFDRTYSVRDDAIDWVTRHPLEAYRIWERQQAKISRMAPLALLLLGNAGEMDAMAFGLMALVGILLLCGVAYAIGYRLGGRDTAEEIKDKMALTRAAMMAQGRRHQELFQWCKNERQRLRF